GGQPLGSCDGGHFTRFENLFQSFPKGLNTEYVFLFYLIANEVFASQGFNRRPQPAKGGTSEQERAMVEAKRTLDFIWIVALTEGWGKIYLPTPERPG
ncbi:hypothetical protein QN391_25305, partial [Pseudomonas sp. CCI1.2]|uniref:hypothetical protein n=1 Tax=Pseudomonas sp. CCI1.2 TaxID=3048614 RepID=UPI002B23DEB2